MGDRLVRKGLVVGIIVLFIGAGIYPAIAFKINLLINSITYTSNELIEFPMQIFGLKGVKSYKISVTKQQYDDFQVLIKRFKEDFENADTMKESVRIYRDMVVSLNELGLLPKGMSIRDAEKLVLGPYYYLDKLALLSDKIIADEPQQSITGNDWELENTVCLISGNSYGSGPNYGDSSPFSDIIYILTGFRLWIGDIYYGFNVYSNNNSVPAEGWIHTHGLKGKWTHEGQFYGKIRNVNISYEDKTLLIGIKDFRGICIGYYDDWEGFGSYHYGYAKRVKISDSPLSYP